jgi:hypothetical protein
VRDRRWDHLYDRQKQPVKQFVLEKFAEELAAEVAAWPPAQLEWTSEDLRRRYQAGTAAPPREPVIRLALEVARLDLRHAFEEIDRLVAGERGAAWRAPADRAGGELLVRLVTERCLELKERADALRLRREDLVAAVDLVERRLLSR